MSEAAAVAFLSWGRWVADCPNPECSNAMGLDPGQAEFWCHTTDRQGRPEPPAAGVACGTRAPVAWPPDAEVTAVDVAAAGLPPAHRSWSPGEDIPS
jgi:hypothetical protein